MVQQQLPFLRIGHGQPVRGTKILADCFEAVLGEFGNALAGDFCRYQRVCTDLLLPVLPSCCLVSCAAQDMYSMVSWPVTFLAVK